MGKVLEHALPALNNSHRAIFYILAVSPDTQGICSTCKLWLEPVKFYTALATVQLPGESGSKMLYACSDRPGEAVEHERKTYS